MEQLKKIGLKNIAEARKMSADELLAKTQTGGLATYCLDGYFFNEDPTDAYVNGHQQKVPLLVGRNSMEMTPQAYLGAKPRWQTFVLCLRLPLATRQMRL